MTEIVFFFILALGLLVSAALVVGFKNPIYSAISLVVTFLLMAGVYALLSAPFLAVIQVMVYAGAIMVLFVFVIMLLNLSEDELGKRKFTLTKVVAALVGLFVVAAVAMAFTDFGTEQTTEFPGLNRITSVPDADEVKLANFGEKLDDEGNQVALAPGEREKAQARVSLWEQFGSIEAVGMLLYTKWLLVFEVTGMLLLAAVVGAVVIARRKI